MQKAPTHADGLPNMQFAMDATRCLATCSKQMQCGHICASSCGPCLKHRRSLESAHETTADVAEAAGGHLPCHQKCSRLLVCGHPCTRTCHAATEPCSDCSRACPMACPHARCSLGCSQVSLISATLSDFLHQPLQPIIPRSPLLV